MNWEDDIVSDEGGPHLMEVRKWDGKIYLIGVEMLFDNKSKLRSGEHWRNPS